MPAFAPIIGARADILILGSMPIQLSLETSQYYANPRNSFWRIMARIFGFDENLSYLKKADHLKQNSIALWDVLYDCQRPGSLDSSIVKGSEVVNDFSGLMTSHPELSLVIFNGATAQRIFNKHCRSLVQNVGDAVQWHLCPSTSPAHASIRVEQKLKVWRQAIERLKITSSKKGV